MYRPMRAKMLRLLSLGLAAAFLSGCGGGGTGGTAVVDRSITTTGSYKTLRTLKNGATVKIDNNTQKKDEEKS